MDELSTDDRDQFRDIQPQRQWQAKSGGKAMQRLLDWAIGKRRKAAQGQPTDTDSADETVSRRMTKNEE